MSSKLGGLCHRSLHNGAKLHTPLVPIVIEQTVSLAVLFDIKELKDELSQKVTPNYIDSLNYFNEIIIIILSKSP